MWLVDSVGVVVTKLVDDFGDSVVVVCSEGIADQSFESVFLSLASCGRH